ncbi:MAG: LD-carboxypeptidase [Candidatus Gracilibacteria bacterium]|jgi:muramoyltetrapeptide carboxypeptidase LdcA involved in peptidoglycan recycling|nr:LD-carboxypeptidase [Candidatus Gracilibacteria bacterium]
MLYTKPQRLKKGDTVAVISPSWGGPFVFPHIYENGIENLKKLGLKIKEFPHTKTDSKFNYMHPELRAKDINDAFADPEIKGIVASIGGDDSIRILPFLDAELIYKNPKFFMGYSDTSNIHFFLNQLGLVSFYGPSVMAGFSQMEALGDKFKNHIEDFLFNPFENFTYEPYDFYVNGYPDWSDPKNVGQINEKHENSGFHFLQGQGIVKGDLIGGCIDTIAFIPGTKYWPEENFWQGKILCLETSEEKPKFTYIRRILRALGLQNVFKNISGLVIGRLRDYSEEEKDNFESSLLEFLKDEFDASTLPVISNVDFGHTDPQIILPFGTKAEIDFENKKFSLISSPFEK